MLLAIHDSTTGRSFSMLGVAGSTGQMILTYKGAAFAGVGFGDAALFDTSVGRATGTNAKQTMVTANIDRVMVHLYPE